MCFFYLGAYEVMYVVRTPVIVSLWLLSRYQLLYLDLRNLDMQDDSVGGICDKKENSFVNRVMGLRVVVFQLIRSRQFFKK